MDLLLFFGFLTTTLFFVLTPGPSVAFASAQGIRYGRRALWVTVAGDALGTVVHIVVAASSLTALVALSSLVLPFLQIIGGVFILLMAFQSLRGRHASTEARPMPNTKATFWAGFFACVTNPKAIVFFVALFPAFISPDHNVAVQSLIYGTVFVVLDALFIIGYAELALRTVRHTAARWLNVDVLSGICLSGVGIAMIVKGYRALPSQ